MPIESAQSKALALISAFGSGVSFDIPEIDLSDAIFKVPGDTSIELYKPVEPVIIQEISDGDVDGTGAFDVLMKACRGHLMREYEAGRITGNEYTKTYIAMMEAAMANASQFVLGRYQAFWMAQKSQIDAITGRAELEKQKLEVASLRIQANTAKADYAKSIMSLALAEIEHDKSQYELTFILPKQLDKMTGEITLLTTQNLKLTAETLLTDKQVLKVEADTTQTAAQTQLICKQKENVEAKTLNEPKKGKLLDEQVESTRAQTLDTRTDGATVTGAIGKQKDLYTQQITAYKRDSEIKAARIFSDAWITQKTIDEGLTAPTGFTNASLDQVLLAIKVNNEIGGTVGGGGGGTPPPIA